MVAASAPVMIGTCVEYTVSTPFHQKRDLLGRDIGILHLASQGLDSEHTCTAVRTVLAKLNICTDSCRLRVPRLPNELSTPIEP